MAMCLFAAGNSLLSICLEGAKAYGRPAVLARVHLVMMVDHGRGDGGPPATRARRRRRRPLGGRRGGRRLRGVLLLPNRVDAGGADLGRGVGPGSRRGGDGGRDLPDRALRPSRQHPRGRRRPGPARARGRARRPWSTSPPSPCWRRTAAGDRQTAGDDARAPSRPSRPIPPRRAPERASGSARMPDPTHTVIVPAYNAAETVGQAIGSVSAQTTPSFEVIAVDDGSSDATPELLAAPRRGRFEDPGDAPAERRPERGAKRGDRAGRRGAFLTFLDSDDLLMPALPGDDGGDPGTKPGRRPRSRSGLGAGRGRGRRRVRRGIWPPPGYVTGSRRRPRRPGRRAGVGQLRRRGADRAARGGRAGRRPRRRACARPRTTTCGCGSRSRAFRSSPQPEPLAVVRNRAGSLSKDELELARGVRAVCRAPALGLRGLRRGASGRGRPARQRPNG